MIILLALWSGLSHGGVGTSFNVTRLARRDGLPVEKINHLLQDSAGRLWPATNDGLFHFDGMAFTPMPGSQNPFIPALTEILCLAEDSQRGLWIGTRYDGLYHLNQTGRLQRHVHAPDNPKSLPAAPIAALALDHATGMLLIGTDGEGLALLDPGSGTVQRAEPQRARHVVAIVGQDRRYWVGAATGLFQVTLETGPSAGLHWEPIPTVDGASPGPVSALFQGPENTLWIGSANGELYRMATNQQIPARLHRLESATPIHGLTSDLMGHIWVASADGLYRLDRALGTLTRIAVPKISPLEDAGGLNHIITANNGLIWAASDHGLIRVNPKPGPFQGYLPAHHPADTITALDNVKDQPRRIWAATAGGQLYRLDTPSGTAQTITPNGGGAALGEVRAILDLGKNKLCLGTQKRGGVLLDLERGSIEDLFPHAGVNVILDGGKIPDEIWLGTDGAGLVQHNVTVDKSITYLPSEAPQKGPGSAHITALIRDTQDRLWAGTRNAGLSCMIQPGAFKHYRANAHQAGALSSNRITAVLALDQHIWVGTRGGGLNRLDQDGERFHVWRRRDGLPDDTIHAMTRDGEGRLWLSTNAGLVLFDPRDVSIRTYRPSDGVLGLRFSPLAAIEDADGQLWFGGEGGLTRVFQKRIQAEPAPSVLLHDLSTPAGSNNTKPPAMTYDGPALTHVALNQVHVAVSFHFKGLDFIAPQDLHYQYRLEGYESQWRHDPNVAGRADYVDLPPGNYQFHVKAAGRDGVWGPESITEVEVQSAAWTRFPPALVGAVLIGLSAGLWFAFFRRQPKVEPVQPKETRPPTIFRERFLADSSAELRAPLSGIVGLAEALLDGADGAITPKTRAHLEMIRNSGRRLTHVVDEIIDFSQLKTEMQQLNITLVDAHSMADVVLSTLRRDAANSNVTLVNQTPNHLPSVMADPKRLEQILINLVENGFDDCRDGAITLAAEAIEDSVSFSVRLNGPQAATMAVTPAYDQVEDAFDMPTSTRLGLEIARMLIALHGSRLQVEQGPEGSTWFFLLPVAGEQGAPTDLEEQLPPALPPEEWSEEPADTHAAVRASGETFRILIVDDEQINRTLVTEFLSLQHYEAVDAADGPEALALLESQNFDLVLLDIMMPRMSGYEVCRQIRRTRSEEALPVIFLSAKDQTSDAATGFEAGGNDYLSKPVAKKELLIRIRLHLRNLEVNRRLEALISERTAKLAARTQELEAMNQEILKTREQVILQEKMAGLGMVTAGLAHEINNPTNFTFSAAQTMNRELNQFKAFLFELAGEDADAEVLDAFSHRLAPLFKQINTIEDGCRRIVELVSDIRSASRTDRAHPVAADIHKGLRTTLRLVRTHYKHQVDFELDLKGQVLVSGMPNQLNQVFMNLMVNACQAVKKRRDGEAEPQTGHVRIASKVAGDRVLIQISDDGCGMNESLRAQIFEPFFTTKGSDEGTGLGLSISKDIITKHGGELTVISTEGKGSTFTIALPFQSVNPDSEAPHGVV